MTLPCRYIARVVIHFMTPFIIGGGREDLFADQIFIEDMNGLPTLPGSSIAGAIRSRFRRMSEFASREDSIFGYQRGSSGEGSRLTVSWACIHDKDDVPVEGLISSRKITGDPVLCNAIAGMVRDHVRIGHHGAAEGKFDERCVSAGHRFTFELMLEGDRSDKKAWDAILGIISSGIMRLGGKTRRGLGKFEVHSLQERAFDLASATDFESFADHPVSLTEKSEVLGDEKKDFYRKEPVEIGDILMTLSLKPQDFWLIGGGPGDVIDITPVVASRIIWPAGGKGEERRDEVYLPGTAVKGPLAHRVAYYLNAFNKRYADEIRPDEHMNCVGSGSEAVAELFGLAKDEANLGRPGRVFIDDLFLGTLGDSRQKILNHVSIDRFTGGARTMSGALYTESPICDREEISLIIGISEYKDLSEDAKKALCFALRDLAEEQLAIGSGTTRGNGYFKVKDIDSEMTKAGMEVFS